ncbi:MAG TPA: AAA family ATPase [Lachnospiraceae bacterium]|jgi:AAA15 family ATPase/GTPase|nr:AAA family ATPase [Lachnospiraceae bacterium]
MLKKFSVTNFKGFENKTTLDLGDVRNYAFNEQAIDPEEKIVKLALLYGPNGIGKSNLCHAIFDIVSNLTDNRVSPTYYESNYSNGNTDPIDLTEFEYLFQFKGIPVRYAYGKKSFRKIQYESLTIGDKTVLHYDKRIIKGKPILAMGGTESLNIDLDKIDISLVKYVKANSILTDTVENITFNLFFSFVERMLEFWSLDRRDFQGFEPLTNNGRNIGRDIIDQKNVEEFKQFLGNIGVENNIVAEKNPDGEFDLYYNYKNRKVDFLDNCSSGIRALTLFFFWLQRMRDSSHPASLVCIDEFDAFYNYSISAEIIKLLKKVNCQVILTTHNTTLMTNELLRPDCFFIMSQEKIASFPNLTDKELRHAHNLEKMYKSKMFVNS